MRMGCLTVVVSMSAAIGGVIAGGSAAYELQYDSAGLRPGEILVMGQFFTPQTKSEEELSAEPKYKSDKPLYVTAKFGNSEDPTYTIVLDESNGTGKGYDTLYVDRNNNEDLTDDLRVEGHILARSSDFKRVDFPRFEILVDYGDKKSPYHCSMELFCPGQIPVSSNGAVSVYANLTPTGYYVGTVAFGGYKKRIAVVDFNGNGLFNEYCKTSPQMIAPDGRLFAVGDHVLIDVNGDGRFEIGFTDNKELFFQARYVNVGGAWYSLDISPDGSTVEVKTPALRTGTVSILDGLDSCSVQLLSEDGVLKIAEASEEFQVPVGTYQLYAHNVDMKHSSGMWHFEAVGTVSGKKIEVKEDAATSLEFGSPLSVNVTHYPMGPQEAQPKAGDDIQLSLTVSGAGGEQFMNIQKDGKLPPAPTYKVVDETGKTVLSGDFEYG